MTKQELLKTHFGYDTFREGQEAVIDALLAGKDVLAVMPTGAGKSICYQVPALMMKGITLVISPLISLMKDQVRSLNQAGISAAYLNSSLPQGQYFTALRYAKAGRYPIIYVAPERLTTDAFLDFVLSAEISMIAVDEAHCVSQWGQDFRPSYLNIAEFVAQLPKRPVISAYTATATKEVREDIARLLDLKDPFCTTTGFDRENLYFAVKTPKDKYKEVHDYILEHPDDSGIIYCLTRKLVEEVCGKLIRDGISATRYHAGLSDEAVSQTLDATRIVNEGIAMIEQEFDQKLESGSLGCTRLMSHMYYMILRTRKGEGTNADFNEFIFQNYPRTGEAAKRVCDYMSRQLKQPVAKEEIGFLAIHIQRVISPDTV